MVVEGSGMRWKRVEGSGMKEGCGRMGRGEGVRRYGGIIVY